jgi:NADH-quinone oxidoreductase subunit M
VPDASILLAPFIVTISLIAIVYIGFVALIQTDMKKLVAYSSISHMGFVTLGFFLFVGGQGSALGIEGGLMQMISHGFVSAAMFLCIGVMYDRLHSRNIADYGGVANVMPKFAALMMLFGMANAGLPGTSGFIGEFTVTLAAVKQGMFWTAACAGLALILGAAYTLWMYKRVIFGDIGNDHVAEMKDVSPREFWMLMLVAACVLGMGLYPAPFTEVMHKSVDALLLHVSHSKL